MSSALNLETCIFPPAPPRRGWLRHGNRPGDYAKAPRCGARTRIGGCCRQPAMRNGRCRMQGGLSTGPRSAEGLARSRRARWKHGFCSTEIRTLRRNTAQTARNLAGLVRLARSLGPRRSPSSLGRGFIERNCPAAGRSSGAPGRGPLEPPIGFGVASLAREPDAPCLDISSASGAQ
ncbi:MAG: HGGxSTG domain-containing protein [Dongiaceae bacterium]